MDSSININESMNIGENIVREMVRFAGIDLYQGLQTFTPKKQSEYIIDCILENVDMNAHLNIIDICTGIGNIAITLALALPNAIVYGTDIHEISISTAKKNAEYHRLEERTRLLTGNLFDPIMGMNLKGMFDVVVSNPPYISSSAVKQREELSAEPTLALDGGFTGFKYYKGIINSVGMYLKPGGLLVLEAGSYGAGKAIVEMIEPIPASIRLIPEMNEVIVLARWSGNGG